MWERDHLPELFHRTCAAGVTVAYEANGLIDPLWIDVVDGVLENCRIAVTLILIVTDRSFYRCRRCLEKTTSNSPAAIAMTPFTAQRV